MNSPVKLHLKIIIIILIIITDIYVNAKFFIQLT